MLKCRVNRNLAYAHALFFGWCCKIAQLVRKLPLANKPGIQARYRPNGPGKQDPGFLASMPMSTTVSLSMNKTAKYGGKIRTENVNSHALGIITSSPQQINVAL